mmetsp:Transcript_108869/g.340653  ORF Transcript_108869/g.340653 Transcript_108869/m.340653 type:complete len:219 (+) Transcript_108869:1-657(+)
MPMEDRHPAACRWRTGTSSRTAVWPSTRATRGASSTPCSRGAGRRPPRRPRRRGPPSRASWAPRKRAASGTSCASTAVAGSASASSASWPTATRRTPSASRRCSRAWGRRRWAGTACRRTLTPSCSTATARSTSGALRPWRFCASSGVRCRPSTPSTSCPAPSGTGATSWWRRAASGSWGTRTSRSLQTRQSSSGWSTRGSPIPTTRLRTAAPEASRG